MSRLQALLDEGRAQGIYPAARAVVLADGKVVFEGGSGAPPDAIFDLASLTKVMSTTAIFMSLWAEGKLGPEAPLSRFLPEAVFAKSPLTVSDLLYHRSGMVGWVPYFAPVMRIVPELFDRTSSASSRTDVRAEIIRAAADTPLQRPAREAAVYSDVGFLLLGEVIEKVAGAPLDVLFEQRIARPLGLTDTRYRRLSARLGGAERILPTGLTRPREPAPGQDDYRRIVEPRPSPAGEVDDDNAWVMDGVAAHAGLFGTAADVARFGQGVLDELEGAGRIAPAPLWQRAIQLDPLTPGSTRALGFDTPSTEGSSAGARIGRDAIGHLGFTGTSLWIDLARRRVFSLLTNRTFNGRQEVRIKDFRPRFHDLANEELG